MAKKKLNFDESLDRANNQTRKDIAKFAAQFKGKAIYGVKVNRYGKSKTVMKLKTGVHVKNFGVDYVIAIDQKKDLPSIRKALRSYNSPYKKGFNMTEASKRMKKVTAAIEKHPKIVTPWR